MGDFIPHFNLWIFIIMKNLIRKALKEDMGLRIDRLQSLQPKNYLIQSLKNKEEVTKINQIVKDVISEYEFLYETIKEDLTYLNYNDISFQKSEGFLYVILPKYLNDKFKKLKKVKNKITDLSYKHQNLKIDVDSLEPSEILNEWDYYFIENGIYLYLDPGNRTHFPKGLPKQFKGYNLGYKIYRKLLDKLSYMQSSHDASFEVQNIYRNLLKETDVNCVVVENSVLLIKKDIPINKKIKLISDFIRNQYMDTNRTKPYVINKDVVVDSDLLKTVGLYKLKEIFQTKW